MASVPDSPSKNSAIRWSSFVPDGTHFVLARSPSDESPGYFRASLRDLGSRCMLMRSDRLVAGEPSPVAPRMTRISRKVIALTLLAAIAASLPVQAQLPLARLSTLFPAGGRTGTTFEVTATGTDLDEANQLHFSHSNITAQPKIAEKTGEPEPNKFLVTIASNATAGNSAARFLRPTGV